MASNSTNRKLGIILQYGQMALSIIINLIYTPIMLRMLGQNEYGIYNLASSIIAYLSLLSLGFGASYIRFYTRYKAGNDDTGIRQLNGLYLLVFALMGAVALISGIILSFNVRLFFNSSYSDYDLYIAKILMIFLSVNLAISFPASIFTSYISSQEKFIFQKILNMGKTVFSPVLCIAVLFLGYASIGMVIVTTAVSLLIDLINVIYCLTKLKMRFSLRNAKFTLLKEIAGFSLFIAINQIIDQINWQTDKIILAKMVNGSAVAIYAVGANINAMFINFSTAVSSVFVPQMHMIQNSDLEEEDKNKFFTELFIKVGRIQFLILGLILSGFIFFGEFFVIKWAGEEYVNAYFISLLLIVPVTIPLCQNLGIEIQRAKNKHKFRSIVYLFMAIINIAISILLTHFIGIFGAAVGTTISLLLANGLIMNIYYHKRLGIDIVRFWKQILRMSLGLILPCLLGVCCMLFIHYTELWQFILLVLCYTLIYCGSMWFISLNGYEKSLIIRPLKKIFKRQNGDAK